MMERQQGSAAAAATTTSTSTAAPRIASDTRVDSHSQHGRNNRHKSNRQRSRHSSGDRSSNNTNSSRKKFKTDAPIISKCSVCDEGEPKYKCPKCRASYCGIACCKKHKEELCQSSAVAQQQLDGVIGADTGHQNAELAKKRLSKYETAKQFLSTATATSYLPRLNNKYNNNNMQQQQEEDWKPSPEMIQALHDSPWLAEELQDDALQTILTSIVQASNIVRRHKPTTIQEDLLIQLKQYSPAFELFTDKLLVLTGLLQRPGQDNDTTTRIDPSVETWLSQTCNHYDLPHDQPFVFKSLPSRKPNIKLQAVDDEASVSEHDEDTSSSSEEENSTEASSDDEEENSDTE